MNSRKVVQYVGCFLVALLASTTCYIIDSQRTVTRQSEHAAQLARQISSQAEGLFLNARQRGEKNPLGWSIRILSQGFEPRIVRITQELQGPENGEALEYDRGTGAFRYTRKIDSETSSAIRVSIATGYSGFLGTGSRLASDVAFALLFSGLLFLGIALTASRAAKARTADLREAILAWTDRARVALLDLGGRIRELVRQANQISTAVVGCHEATVTLRERIHQKVRTAREGRKNSQQLTGLLLQAEVLSLNLIVENSKAGALGDQARGMAEELHRLIAQVQEIGLETANRVSALERDLEPMATDADLAFHALDDIFGSIRGMDSKTTETTQSLLKHAQLMQDLKGSSARLQ